MSDNAKLQEEIRELQRQIALLGMKLGVKKMESRHPTLEKLLDEVGARAEWMNTEAGHLVEYGREHLGEISLRKGLSIFGIVVALGTAGYLLLSMLDSRRS